LGEKHTVLITGKDKITGKDCGTYEMTLEKGRAIKVRSRFSFV
jgi:hypothetical protein